MHQACKCKMQIELVMVTMTRALASRSERAGCYSMIASSPVSVSMLRYFRYLAPESAWLHNAEVIEHEIIDAVGSRCGRRRYSMSAAEAERGKTFGASATEAGFVPAHDHRITAPLSSFKPTPRRSHRWSGRTQAHDARSMCIQVAEKASSPSCHLYHPAAVLIQVAEVWRADALAKKETQSTPLCTCVWPTRIYSV